MPRWTHRPQPKPACARTAPTLRTKQGSHSSLVRRDPRTISLPQREATIAFKDALALPLGFGRGEFSLKGLRVHVRSFNRSPKFQMATDGNTK
jgi:hypothetical protein